MPLSYPLNFLHAGAVIVSIEFHGSKDQRIVVQRHQHDYSRIVARIRRHSWLGALLKEKAQQSCLKYLQFE